MIEEYREEVNLQVGKPSLTYLLADPHLFSGISGHLSLYRMPNEKRDPLPTEGLNRYTNVYKAIFTLRENDLKVVDCFLKGPEILPNNVRYTLISTDEKVRGSFDFILRRVRELTTVDIGVKMEYKGGIFSSYHSSKENLSQHIVVEHLLPYLQGMRSRNKLEITETLHMNEDIKALLHEVMELPRISFGYLLIKGDHFKMSGKVVNGNLEEPVLKVNHEEFKDGEAISELFKLRGEAELILYEIDVNRETLETISKST